MTEGVRSITEGVRSVTGGTQAARVFSGHACQVCDCAQRDGGYARPSNAKHSVSISACAAAE